MYCIFNFLSKPVHIISLVEQRSRFSTSESSTIAVFLNFSLEFIAEIFELILIYFL